MTITGRIGTAAVVVEAHLPANINQHIVRMRVDTRRVLPEYLALYLNSSIGSALTNRGVSGTTRVALDYGAIHQILLSLPPLDVQQELVDKMNAARQAYRDMLAQAEALLSGLDDFLIDQLRLSLRKAFDKDNRRAFAVRLGQTEGKRFDAHFYRPQFAEMAQSIRSVPHEPLGRLVDFSTEVWNPNAATSDTFRYIEISGVNLRSGQATAVETLVAEAPSRARMFVRQGDIIVSLTRPHHGAIASVDEELDGCVASTGFAVIRKLTDDRVNGQYLWCVLRSQLCLRQMLQRSSGGNYPAITESELRQVLVPVPRSDVRDRIVAEVEQRQTEARRLRQEAAEGWAAAKARFERRLLGEEA